eukprot:1606763-Pyramimonas_sp.AAC.1
MFDSAGMELSTFNISMPTRLPGGLDDKHFGWSGFTATEGGFTATESGFTATEGGFTATEGGFTATE